MTFWYNIRTGQVEPGGTTTRKEDLMGPYPSEAEAARALETARERTEKWDEEDRRDREWGSGKA